MLRQHDPDFIDGNHIAVFDNNTRFNTNDNAAYSRILRIAVPSNTVEEIYKGSPTEAFYTATLGKQQWLANGNILFSNNEKGEAKEITRDGETVWHFANLINASHTAAIQEVARLPEFMNKAWFNELANNCQEANK